MTTTSCNSEYPRDERKQICLYSAGPIGKSLYCKKLTGEDKMGDFTHHFIDVGEHKVRLIDISSQTERLTMLYVNLALSKGVVVFYKDNDSFTLDVALEGSISYVLKRELKNESKIILCGIKTDKPKFDQQYVDSLVNKFNASKNMKIQHIQISLDGDRDELLKPLNMVFEC
jgi:hypothetical protein